jgi:glycosyltransferase involved in cell wall biosynthesis
MSTVAIILPVYRGDNISFFKQSINSLIGQSYSNIKIIIGVDGTIGDKLKSCLVNFESNVKIKLFWFEQNRGLAIVLNDLLTYCFKEGYEYVARMDADDISMPERISQQVAFLQAHPSIDVVGGAIKEIDENSEYRGKTIYYPKGPEECYKFFSYRNPHAHPAVLFRKSFFEKADCMYRPEYRQNQDTMLWYDGMIKGTMHANISDVVLYYRMTDSLFKKRRNGWSFAKKQLTDRKMINKGLGYGVWAQFYAYCMFIMLISPAWIKKIAYKVFR